MISIKASELLKKEIKPFLFGAFLNRIMDTKIDKDSYFYCYSKFRNSKAVFKSDFDFIPFAKVLIEKYNRLSGYFNWQIHSVKESSIEIRFYVLNDLSISKTIFYKMLYQKLNSTSWIMDENISEDKKSFIRGFMEPRGSVDTTAKLISQDYFYNDRIELKKAQILTDMMNLPIEYANFNPRNLQPQYISGENKRNAQFRINVFFYASKIGFLNDYKALIFDKSYSSLGRTVKDDVIYFSVSLPPRKNDDIVFIKYLNFFTNNIYQKQLTANSIVELRKKLGFEKNVQTSKYKRDQSIIEIFREISEDKCAICGTTDTFINRTTNRPHFEIHHMISFHNGKEFDNIANLVKLCPTCHDMMKKGAASKETQIKAIIKILGEHHEIYEFTSGYLGLTDINELADKIWTMLG